jgi:hypothetical protein
MARRKFRLDIAAVHLRIVGMPDSAKIEVHLHDAAGGDAPGSGVQFCQFSTILFICFSLFKFFPFLKFISS